MERSTWILLISIPALIVSTYFVRRRKGGALGCSVRSVHGAPNLCRWLAKLPHSARPGGADGRAKIADARLIGTARSAIGRPIREPSYPDHNHRQDLRDERWVFLS
jgi:hypothetical protein